MKKRILAVTSLLLLAAFSFAGCGEDSRGTVKVKVLLDWVPNTNHTGIYAARDKDYYEEEGLDVEIIQPPGGGSADLVAAGKGEFGLSYQEQVTYARTADTPLPVKAIAAIIQHNTSGFASPAEKGIKNPADFEGKRYGGWGSPVEEAMLKALMQADGADFSKVEMVTIGEADFFASVRDNVDFTWIYYGWDGIAAEVRNFPINFIRLQDVVEQLDFYTPVIIAAEEFLKDNPDVARRFLKATSRGYMYSIQNPEDAVKCLLEQAPEIDWEIAVASQKYLAGKYVDDADRWGQMKLEVWNTYADWMYDKGLTGKKLDAKEAFTNEYLPK